MIHITQPALTLCNKVVQQLAGAQTASKCLRLVQRDGGFSISFEVPRSDDRIVHHNGQSIVAVPTDVIESVSGKTLDLADDGSLVIA